MITVEVLQIEGGVVCLHCGTKRISKGEQCLVVNNGRGTGYIALDHKDLHPWTKGFKLPEPEKVS